MLKKCYPWVDVLTLPLECVNSYPLIYFKILYWVHGKMVPIFSKYTIDTEA